MPRHPIFGIDPACECLEESTEDYASVCSKIGQVGRFLIFFAGEMRGLRHAHRFDQANLSIAVSTKPTPKLSRVVVVIRNDLLRMFVLA